MLIEAAKPMFDANGELQFSDDTSRSAMRYTA
jgi:hypothetical protein